MGLVRGLRPILKRISAACPDENISLLVPPPMVPPMRIGTPYWYPSSLLVPLPIGTPLIGTPPYWYPSYWYPCYWYPWPATQFCMHNIGVFQNYNRYQRLRQILSLLQPTASLVAFCMRRSGLLAHVSPTSNMQSRVILVCLAWVPLRMPFPPLWLPRTLGL